MHEETLLQAAGVMLSAIISALTLEVDTLMHQGGFHPGWVCHCPVLAYSTPESGGPVDLVVCPAPSEAHGLLRKLPPGKPGIGRLCVAILAPRDGAGQCSCDVT